jgi:hypothetical protein
MTNHSHSPPDRPATSGQNRVHDVHDKTRVKAVKDMAFVCPFSPGLLSDTHPFGVKRPMYFFANERVPYTRTASRGHAVLQDHPPIFR